MGTEQLVTAVDDAMSFRTIINYMGTEQGFVAFAVIYRFRTIINYMGTEHCCNENMNMNWF